MSYYIINHFVNDFTKSYFKIQYIQIPDLDMKQNSFEKKRFDLFYLSSKEILSINLVNRNKPLEVFVKLSENPLNATQFSHLDQGRLEE